MRAVGWGLGKRYQSADDERLRYTFLIFSIGIIELGSFVYRDEIYSLYVVG